MKKGQGLQEWQMLSIRIPINQSDKLTERANQIGISKTALGMITIKENCKNKDLKLLEKKLKIFKVIFMLWQYLIKV